MKPAAGGGVQSCPRSTPTPTHPPTHPQAPGQQTLLTKAPPPPTVPRLRPLQCGALGGKDAASDREAGSLHGRRSGPFWRRGNCRTHRFRLEMGEPKAMHGRLCSAAATWTAVQRCRVPAFGSSTFSLSVSLCLSLCLSVSFSLSLSLCLFVSLSVCLTVSLSPPPPSHTQTLSLDSSTLAQTPRPRRHSRH
jgi:hypothetical protein